MAYARDKHLATLKKDIGAWRSDADKQEKAGNAEKARVLRSWAKSAQRVADLLETGKYRDQA